MKGIIGKKVGMTQVFDENGNAIPVTVIQAGPCFVTQIRNGEKDGYTAMQLGFGETKPQRLTKGELGHLKRNNLPALRHLREFRLQEWRSGRGRRAGSQGRRVCQRRARGRDRHEQRPRFRRYD